MEKRIAEALEQISWDEGEVDGMSLHLTRKVAAMLRGEFTYHPGTKDHPSPPAAALTETRTPGVVICPLPPEEQAPTETEDSVPPSEGDDDSICPDCGREVSDCICLLEMSTCGEPGCQGQGRG